MNCPQCGHKNSVDDLVCIECGADLEETDLNIEETPSRGSQNKSKADTIAVDLPRSALVDLMLGKEGTTDASLITSTLIGLFLTGIWYFIFPVPILSSGYFYDIFVNRGNIPYFIVWFTCSALVILLIKAVKMISQRSVFQKNLIPASLQIITSRNANNLIKNISVKVPRPKTKILANRIILALHQYKNTGSIEQASNILSYQAEIDLGALDASYTMVNTFIWAVPILGFLGTVIGIGSAIGGFTLVIEQAVEIEAIKGALQVVTGGLATAFDTTLLGLCSAMVLMFISSPLRKLEEEFLSSIEIFAIDNILNRMRGKSGVSVGEDQEVITDKNTANKFKRIVENAVEKCLKDLESSFVSWKEGFSEVLGQMTSQTKDITEQLSGVNPIIGTFQEIMGSFTTSITDLSRNQSQMIETFSEEIKQVQPLVGNLKTISTSLAEERKIFLNQVDTWISNFDKLGEKTVGQMRELFSGLEEERRNFLTSLGEERNVFNNRSQEWISNFNKNGEKFFAELKEEHRVFTISLGEERNAFNDRSQEWISNFYKNGEEFFAKLDSHNSQQYQSIQTIIHGLEQQSKAFDEGIGKWIKDFDTVGKDMFSATESTLQKIDGISEVFTDISNKYEETIRELKSTNNQLLTSGDTFKQAQEGLGNLINNQEQLMSLFNKSFEQQVTSDSLFKETLVGIKDGLENLGPSLATLAKPRKVRLIEE